MEARILLVLPLTPLLDWATLLTAEKQDWVHLDGSHDKRVRLAQERRTWNLITYRSLLFTPELINNESWTAVALDESTEIKNPKAQITKLLLRMRCEPAFRVIMAGKPAPQKFTELWSQMAWANAGEWMGYDNYWKWQDAFTVQQGFDRVIPFKDLAVIKTTAHAQASFLTRKQANVGNVKLKTTRCGSLSPAVKKVYAQIVKSWEVPGSQAKHSIVIAGWLRRICGGFMPGGSVDSWKYADLCNLLSTDLKQVCTVIWFAWSDEIARAGRCLHDAGIRVGIIQGSTSLAERARLVGEFRAGTIKALLVQLACGKFGLDLSVSDTAIYFSNSDSYLTRSQSEDRIESLNKTRTLHCIDYVTLNTCEVDLMEALRGHHCDSAYLASKIEQTRRAG